MCIPSLDAWDQFLWPPGAAVPRATTEVEQYGYCCGHAIDLSPVMPATQFRVTDEAGTYLCAARALVFEGSVLAYNPARDEAEWVPTHGVANDLSWAEEKSAMALANYVPHISQEVARIAGLRTHRLVSWTTPPRRRRKMNRRKRNMRKQRDREKQAPNCLRRRSTRVRRDGARGRTTEMTTIAGVGVYHGRGRTSPF